MAICIECGKEYTQTASSRGLCSTECRRKYMRRMLGNRTRKCAECNKEFIPTTPRNIYCSDECRVKFQARVAKENNEKKALLKKKEEFCKRKKTCYYGAFLTSGVMYCNYIEIEGKARGCTGRDCDKYKPRGKKKLNPFTGRYEYDMGAN